jgi:hypothetical protein
MIRDIRFFFTEELLAQGRPWRNNIVTYAVHIFQQTPNYFEIQPLKQVTENQQEIRIHVEFEDSLPFKLNVARWLT